MSIYSIYCAETGLFNGDQIGGDSEFVGINTPAGFAAFPGRHHHKKVRLDLLLGEVVDYQPPSPGDDEAQTWAWDVGARRWVPAPTLAARRALAWAAIKSERERRLAGTFAHAGNTYGIDPVNIAGASIDAREALLAGELLWSQMWVLSNNTTVTLTAAEMIAVGRACKTAVTNLWATSQFLRGQIEAAPTLADIEAITWP